MTAILNDAREAVERNIAAKIDTELGALLKPLSDCPGTPEVGTLDHRVKAAKAFTDGLNALLTKWVGGFFTEPGRIGTVEQGTAFNEFLERLKLCIHGWGTALPALLLSTDPTPMPGYDVNWGCIATVMPILSGKKGFIMLSDICHNTALPSEGSGLCAQWTKLTEACIRLVVVLCLEFKPVFSVLVAKFVEAALDCCNMS